MISYSDVYIGAVAVFDCSLLNRSQLILIKPKSLPTDYRRPFVCLYTKKGFSLWAEITSKEGNHQKLIDVEFRTGAYGWRPESDPHWKGKPQSIQSATSYYYGSDQAFIQASHNDFIPSYCRRNVSQQGVTELRKFIYPTLSIF